MDLCALLPASVLPAVQQLLNVTYSDYLHGVLQ
jgi:hypothetical protein